MRRGVVGLVGGAAAALVAALVWWGGGGMVGAAGEPGARMAAGPAITVYKSATCGCCRDWVGHLERDGFVVTTIDLEALEAVKERYGVPRSLWSCHTGIVAGKVIEGHVPADIIRSFLAEPMPDADGLAVPGMPMGSPGMEGPYRERYDVFAFRTDGEARVYASR
ncbi:MAG: DUF411 domain-containing protein [Longimicrobiales bacterium]